MPGLLTGQVDHTNGSLTVHVMKRRPTVPDATSASHKRAQGKAKTSSRPSRTQPSQPLHMTTRTRSKNATHSTINSVTSGDSRRNSLNSARSPSSSASQDGDEESRPRMRARTESTKSSEPRIQHDVEFDDLPMTDGDEDGPVDMSRTQSQFSVASSTVQQALAADEEPDDPEEDVPAKTNGISANMNGSAIDVNDEADDEAVAPPVEEVQTMRTRPKRRSTRSRPSLEETAINSGPSSTATTPPRLSGGGQDDLDADDAGALATATTFGAAQMGTRLPGRRRQAHQDDTIEATLRRQLLMKMEYRKIAKVVKQIEVELNSRAIDQLEDDPEAHMKCDSFEDVEAELDRILEEKLADLDRQRQIEIETLKREQAAEEHIYKEQCAIQIRDIKEDYSTRAEYKLLEIERDISRNFDDNVTEPEYDLIQPQGLPKGIICSKYDSRSRVFQETEKLASNFQRRSKLDEMAIAFVKDDEDYADLRKSGRAGFATYDANNRTNARIRHAMRMCLEAADLIEAGGVDVPGLELPAEHIRNEEATALQVLADAMEKSGPVDTSKARAVAKRPSRKRKSSSPPPNEPPAVRPSSRPEAARQTLPSINSDGNLAPTQTTPRVAAQKLPATQPFSPAQPQTSTPKANRINDLLNRDEPTVSPRNSSAMLPDANYPLTNGFLPPSQPAAQQPPPPTSTHASQPARDPPRSPRSHARSDGRSLQDDRFARESSRPTSLWSNLDRPDASWQHLRRSPDRAEHTRQRDTDRPREDRAPTSDERRQSRDDGNTRRAERAGPGSTDMGPPNRRQSVQYDYPPPPPRARRPSGGVEMPSPRMRDMRASAPAIEPHTQPVHYERPPYYGERRPSAGSVREDPRSPPYRHSQTPTSNLRDTRPGTAGPYEQYPSHHGPTPQPHYSHPSPYGQPAPPPGPYHYEHGPPQYGPPPQGPPPPGHYPSPYQHQFPPPPPPQQPAYHHGPPTMYPPPPSGSPANATPYHAPAGDPAAGPHNDPRGPPGPYNQAPPPPSPHGAPHPPSPYHQGPPSYPYQPPGPPQPYYGPPGPTQLYPPPPPPSAASPPHAYGPPPPPPHSAPRPPSRGLPPTGPHKRRARSNASNGSASQPPAQMQTQFSIHPPQSGKQPLLPAPSDGRSPVAESPGGGAGASTPAATPTAAAPPPPPPPPRMQIQQHVPPPPQPQPRASGGGESGRGGGGGGGGGGGPTSGDTMLPKKRHRQYMTIPGTIFRGYQPKGAGGGNA